MLKVAVGYILTLKGIPALYTLLHAVRMQCKVFVLP